MQLPGPLVTARSKVQAKRAGAAHWGNALHTAHTTLGQIPSAIMSSEYRAT